jgi:hypothetical protein
MKARLAILTLLLLSISVLETNAQNIYRSRVTGNWTTPGTWELSTNSGSTWITSTVTYPTADSAGTVTLRSPHVVTIPASITIQIDQLTVESGATLSLSANSVLNVVNGSGDDLSALAGSTISGTGTIWGNGANALLVIRSGSNVSCQVLIKQSTSVFSNVSPFICDFFGNVTIESGAALSTVGGGYTARFYGGLVNNGTLSTGNTSGTIDIACPSFLNSGIVNAASVNFSDTTNVSGAGTWASTNITILGGGLLKLTSNMSISSTTATTFQINSAGRFDPNNFTLNFGAATSSKSLIIIGGGSTGTFGLINTIGTVIIDVRTGALFDTRLKINSGITSSYSTSSPFAAVFNNDITVDPGANLRTVAGGYILEANAAVNNNGTISTGNSSGTFRMSGPAITNNGTINAHNLDITANTNIDGTGIWANADLRIASAVTARLLSDMKVISSTGIAQQFLLRTNAKLDLNGKKLILDGTNASITLVQESSSEILETGMVELAGTTLLNIQTGGIFRPSLRVKSGIAQGQSSVSPFLFTIENSLYVDTGATFRTVSGGYTAILRDSIVNQGTVSTGNSSGIIRYFGNYIVNNGLISAYAFRFESVQASLGQVRDVSGTGRFTSTDCQVFDGTYLLVSSSHSFSFLNVNTGAALDIGSNTLKMTGAGLPITMNGGFINTAGTIEYNGTAAQNMVHTGIDYVNLNINNPAGVTVGQNFTIYGLLNVLNGDLNLNGKVIYFASDATLVETPGNTISGTSGYITTTRNIISPNSQNIAGFGATITTGETLGLTEIRRGHSFYLVSGDTSVRRYYVIRPDNNTGLNATCSFKYDDTELNGNIESQLKMLKSTNVGVSFFVGGLSIVDTINNTVTVNSINDFARHTLGPGAAFSGITVAPEGLYNNGNLKLNLRDTVRIELRNSVTPFAVVDTATGVLDSISLTAQVLFSNAGNGNYYVVVKHRNSIETWSKNPQVFTVGASLIYNFTTSQTQAFGDNLKLKGTKWTIYSGDANQDGAVDATDVQNIDNDASNFVGGYVSTDLNGDGFVDGSDFTIGDNNAAEFVGKVTP